MGHYEYDYISDSGSDSPDSQVALIIAAAVVIGVVVFVAWKMQRSKDSGSKSRER